jgi:hypothetical protein
MYLARLCYSTLGWEKPSGRKGKRESANSYSSETGFGNEEWLFRFEWLIDGWHYGFIEGVNRCRKRFLKANEPIDLLLFTIQPDKRRRFVAIVRSIECLNDVQAQAAVATYKELGWYDKMKEEIAAVDGKSKVLENTPLAQHVLNVRFKIEHLEFIIPEIYAPENHLMRKWERYIIYPWHDNIENNAIVSSNSTASPNTGKIRTDNCIISDLQPYYRRGTQGRYITPEHKMMQDRLEAILRSEFPNGSVEREKDCIDIKVTTADEIILYEIKSDLETRTVIRLALGQILEYAYHPSRQYTVSVRLIIVGRRALPPEDSEYLKILRRSFQIPLEYKVVAI